jgi:CubicO group peptidase (beta-lactamase class C family)
MRFAAALLLTALLALPMTVPAHALQQATPSPDLTGKAPLPLTGERRAQFEAYVVDALRRYNVPGASVAVIQHGDIVYLHGFGVTALGGAQPVTPDTMFMIGSITKSLTTMLASALVDDGKLAWDTPLVDLVPGFAVDDPTLTHSLSVRDAFCNCIGIPARNLDFYFQSAALTPDQVVTSLADIAPNAARGELFQYNNALIAAGGYALGAANGGAAYGLGLAYDTALRTRVLRPLGMPRSTFDPNEVLAGGDYAMPHAIDLTGTLRRLPLIEERAVLPVRPAGGLWSNAREMARYLQTELDQGVAPDGTRVVSAENLMETWTPEVTVPAPPALSPAMAASQGGYGLGWFVGEYHGLRMINHAGGTNGFSAEFAFLPEADLGVVVLSNSLQAGMALGEAFPYAVQFRLFEILFDQQPQIDAELATIAAELDAARPALGDIDPAAVTPYVGRYVNPDLGEVTLSLRGGRLILDSGESRSELRPPASDAGDGRTFFFLDPPLSFFSELGTTVSLTGDADAPTLTLTIPANPVAPEQEYVFTPADAAASP